MVYPIFVIKPLILWKKHYFYNRSRVFHIANTPGTKFVKFGLKCSILHFKMNKTLNSNVYFFHLSVFLNPYRKFMLNNKCFQIIKSNIIWPNTSESCMQWFFYGSRHACAKKISRQITSQKLPVIFGLFSGGWVVSFDFIEGILL